MRETGRIEDLAAMAVFARVVEARGFSAAAARLGRSKSSVSKTVSALENRLGARLLNRTTRRLSLTEAGAAFYERAARILAEAEEAELAVTRLQDEPHGTLRVNAPTNFGERHLAPALADFMARHPALAIDLALDDRFVDVVEEGFDLAIRIAALPGSSLIARRLAPNRRVVCASPAYLERAGTPEKPSDLRAHNCLGYTYLATGNAWRFAGMGDPVSVRVSGSLSINNGEALRRAALDGLGLVMLPSFIVGDDLRAGALRAVLHEHTDSPSSVYAVYPHSRHLSAKVRAFVDFLAERFGPEPYWDAA
jgi:DNA-binding transcriptional LysR family regulator